jgi:predicted RNase H-like HicB family nuclease
MTRKYSLVIDGDSSGYSAYVPELPTILVTGQSIEELMTCAKEAIRILLGEPRDRSLRHVFGARNRGRT